MKKLSLLFALFLFLFTQTEATTININIDNNFFDPISFSVQVGDTITWTLVAGMHSTTSTSVPVGASTWDHTFTVPGETFSYEVTVEGVYEYMCTFHPEMLASFSTQMSLPFVEDFDYPASENLTNHGWVAHSGAGTQPQTIGSPGLTFTGYPSSGIGNAALLDNNGEDTHRLFETVTSGSVYMAFMIKVDAASTGYFIHFTPNPHNTFDFRGRLWIQGSGSNLAFKLSYASSDTLATSYNYLLGETYLCVVKYEIVSGALNDIVSLYVFSSSDPFPSTEPLTPTIGPITNGTTSADIEPGSVSLRQFNAGQNIVIDGLRIASSWESALPVELTSFSAIAQNNGVALNWSTASEINNQGFEIERKKENTNWTKIAFVNGSGTTSSENNYAYFDKNIAAGKYQYRLKQIDFDGSFTYSKVVEVLAEVPVKFELSQNYPNPFNPATKISYSIPTPGHVSLKVFNALGQEVASLVNGFTEAGVHTVDFNATNLNSGIYFYKLETSSLNQVKKMMLIK
ncbi:MAG: T9SS C-terminal target domain-containing protein [Ignavibacteriales bacterium]|nr:MAG: T9SS C-terminal target domain-containing protein [Ignavibacteriales bacterium]